MVKYIGTLLLLLVFLNQTALVNKKNYRIHTVAFYNFENLLILLMILQRTMMNGRQKELNIGHQKIPSKLENLSKVLLEIGSAEH
jgi:hypothetical protein